MDAQQKSVNDAGLSYEEIASLGSPFGQFSGTKQALPILAVESNIGRLLNLHQVLFVLGETSSGKSTQLPQMFMRLGWTQRGFKCAVVQPNKIAAIRLTERLEAEMGTDEHVEALTSEEDAELIQRRQNRRSRGKRGAPIVVFDQKSFLRSALALDPQIAAFSLVFLDEVHERTVALDLIMGLMKRLLEFRPDLRLILSSATLDKKSIARYFAPLCATIVAEGRQYPVFVSYLRGPCSNIIDSCMTAIESLVALNRSVSARDVPLTSGKIAPQNIEGDILVFLPTADDCEELVRRVHEEIDAKDTICLPLHEGMSLKDQQLVCGTSSASTSSGGRRKIIAATQIAETALSIPNISIVIDSMFYQESRFDAQAGLMVLGTRAISRSRADQRAGRAGRIAPSGRVLRLCTEQDFMQFLPKHDEPDILRADLVETVLLLKSFGIDDVVDFPFITQPSADQFVRAMDVLFALGAMNEDAELTPLGRQLARLPLPVQLGKTLLTAFLEYEGDVLLQTRIVDLVALIGSSVAGSALASAHQQTLVTCATKEGDHLTLCNMAECARTRGQVKTMSQENFGRFMSFRYSVKRSLAEVGIVFNESSHDRDRYHHSTANDAVEDGLRVMHCVLAGTFTQVAKLQSNGLYRMSREGREVRIHESSVLSRYGKPPEWITFHEAVLLTSARKSLLAKRDDNQVTVVRIVSAIDPRRLLDIAPHFWKRTSSAIS